MLWLCPASSPLSEGLQGLGAQLSDRMAGLAASQGCTSLPASGKQAL